MDLFQRVFNKKKPCLRTQHLVEGWAAEKALRLLRWMECMEMQAITKVLETLLEAGALAGAFAQEEQAGAADLVMAIHNDLRQTR